MELLNEPVIEKEEKLKQRHGCVTAMLIMIIIANSLGALVYFFFNNFILQHSPNNPTPTLLFLLGITGVINVICAVLLFKWKKWGFWGFIISSVLIFIINTSIGLGFFQSLFGLIGLIVMFWVLQFKKNKVTAWDNME